MNYTLDCIDWNDQHVKFRVFDHTGANCGFLTILTRNVRNFVGRCWNSDIRWNDKAPKDFISNPENYDKP